LLDQLNYCREKLRHQLNLYRLNIEHGSAVLANLNPRRLLARGFSIVRDAQGKVIDRKEKIQAAQKLVVEFTDGSAEVQVL
jgi:exodeoxyribonuclease VII large subunit